VALTRIVQFLLCFCVLELQVFPALISSNKSLFKLIARCVSQPHVDPNSKQNARKETTSCNTLQGLSAADDAASRSPRRIYVMLVLVMMTLKDAATPDTVNNVKNQPFEMQ
jgi:hypothetical protein